MVSIKTEVFPEMATPSNCRNRTFETAEKHLFCPEGECSENGTWRVVREHWNDIHAKENRVLSVTCSQESCMWYCFKKNIRCFIQHMKTIHNIQPNANCDFTLTGRIPRKNVKHSQHCNSTSAEATALRKERARLKRIQAATLKREQKIALRQAMRVGPENLVNNFNIPATEVVETQHINITVTSNVNIQVTKTTVQKTRQEANLNRLLDSLAAAPYVDNQQTEYTYEETEVSENPSTNTTEKVTAVEIVEEIREEEPKHILIESDSEEYEIFEDVEIEKGDIIIELGLPEIDTGFIPSESDDDVESSDSEDDIPLVNLRKRKISPVIRSNLKKSRGY